jgi:hypothetical protein
MSMGEIETTRRPSVDPSSRLRAPARRTPLAFLRNPDFLAVLAMTVIGLLVSACLLAMFPLSVETWSSAAEFF